MLGIIAKGGKKICEELASKQKLLESQIKSDLKIYLKMGVMDQLKGKRKQKWKKIKSQLAKLEALRTKRRKVEAIASFMSEFA